MSPRYLCMAALMAFPSLLLGQTGYTITGGLSNFDCGNHCDDDCDEMEIEIDDIRPEDVYHTYRNGNYGSPSVTLSDDGRFTRINYHNPQHLTHVGAIEHFGVSLKNLNAAASIRVIWMRNHAPATVNGVVPNPGGGTAPATQPVMPSIMADPVYTGTGDGLGFSVTNNDLTQPIWVKRKARVVTGMVTLEQLMTTNPVVVESIDVDAAPLFVGPGQTVSTTSDLIEAEEIQTAVFSAQYYQNLHVGGPFFAHDEIGPELGNVMTATSASAMGGCDLYGPQILSQPQSVTVDPGRSITLRVQAEGNDMDLSYQWFKDGVALTNGGHFHAVNSDELDIDEVVPESEGFYALQVSNQCGTVMTDAALVFVTGHNVPPPLVPTCPCVADFDGSGGTPDSSDIDAFFVSWLNGDTAADSDCSEGTPDASDIDAFFTQWLNGGC